MKNKNSAARSLVLLFVLLSVGLFIRGVEASPTFDVTMQQPGKSAYVLGETVRWSGSVEVLDGDPSDTAVTLNIDGPQPVTRTLPVVPGSYAFPENNLVVTVDSVNVSPGTLPGQGPPGSTTTSSGLRLSCWTRRRTSPWCLRPLWRSPFLWSRR